jgi:hypothetical protein
MDHPFHHMKDKGVEQCMYLLQDHHEDSWHDTIKVATVHDPLDRNVSYESRSGNDELH